MGTLAPYAIDRMDFTHMLGDCFEIAMRAAAGYAIGDIDEEGNVTEWVEAEPRDRVRDAEYAFNKVATESLKLLANSLAVERTAGEGFISGGRFEEYIGHFEELVSSYESGYEAVKTSVEYELGMED